MLIQMIVFIAGLLGAALLGLGAGLIYEPAGYLVVGIELLVWSFLMSRALAFKQTQQKHGKEVH